MPEAFSFPARFYGDGPPSWTVGQTQRTPPSYSEAQAGAALLVRHLLARCERGSPGFDLANRLAPCRVGVRCLSGGCPVCARAMQRWVVDAFSKVLVSCKGGVSMLTIIPTAHAPNGVETLTGDFTEAKRRIIAGLEHGGVSFCVGALDLSFNARGGVVVPCAHGAVFGASDEIQAARHALDRAFPPSPSVLRPIRRNSWDGDVAALAYAYKPEATRRVALPRAVNEHGDTVRRANSRSESASVDERIQAALALDEIGLLDRMILRGACVHIVDGRPRLRVDAT